MRDFLRRTLPSPVQQIVKKVVISVSDAWIAEPRRVASRKLFAMSYYSPSLQRIDRWAPLRTENDNFYYELSDLNKLHLVHLVALLTGAPHQRVEELSEELANDTALRVHLRNGVTKLADFRDIEIAYGRRLGWYLLARIQKPRTIVETGVSHGVGSCLMCAALLRNAAEGYEGRYYGTDIDPDAGILLTPPYSAVGQILYGDSISSLTDFDQPIDLFINDSDHSTAYEYREYVTVREKLGDTGVILGDNSHVSDSLPRFCKEAGRSFVFFREQPKDHWYPGAGIGISFPAAIAADRKR